MARPRRKKATNILVWILLGLLVVGLMGFGIGNFSGTVRNVGSVGSVDITVNQYFRSLQSAISTQIQNSGDRMTVSDAIATGASQQALDSLTLSASLTNATRQIGISVGDESVLQGLRNTPEFQGLDGIFDETAYELSLESAGLSKPEYDEIIRDQQALQLLETAVVSGIPPSDFYVRQLVEYYYETRDFEWIEIGEDDLGETDLQGSPAQLRAYFEANQEEFTIPETREISYVWLFPEMITDESSVNEEDALELYETRLDQFIRPEMRIVDRLVFPTTEEAAEAAQSVTDGETDFDSLVADSGILPDDVDLGEVTREDLTEQAADLVFGTDDLDVVGPVQSAVGPALYRVNAILAEQETSFEDARERLVEELSLRFARDSIADRIETYNDILAGGATLEEFSRETDASLASISFNSRSTEQIASMREFREAALSVAVEDYPEITLLSNGGIFALRLDNITPPTLEQFEDVRGSVVESWRAEELRKMKIELAEEYMQPLQSRIAFSELGLSDSVKKIGVKRNDFQQDVPFLAIEKVFELEMNQVAVVDSGEEVGLVRLEGIGEADFDSDEITELLPALESQSSNSMARDIFGSFARSVRQQSDIFLDQAVINSVNSQFQ